jgi:hypothetical protein
MESTSIGIEKIEIFEYTDQFFLAFRIHMSETTAGLLEEIGGFHLEYRGITEIKVNLREKTIIIYI